MTDAAVRGKRSRAWTVGMCVLGAALIGVTGLLSLEGWIRHVARQTGESAVAAYGGDQKD